MKTHLRCVVRPVDPAQWMVSKSTSHRHRSVLVCIVLADAETVSAVRSGVSMDCQRERSRAAQIAAVWCHGERVLSYSIARSLEDSHVQTTCLERAMPMAWLAFAGRPAAPRAGPSGHRSQERERGVRVEGKLKGAGTLSPAEPVCTWGWRGTRWPLCRAMEAAHGAPALPERRACCAVVRGWSLEIAS